jgi:hypothetical protein
VVDKQLLLFLVIFFLVGNFWHLADLSWQLPAWGNSVDMLPVVLTGVLYST